MAEESDSESVILALERPMVGLDYGKPESAHAYVSTRTGKGASYTIGEIEVDITDHSGRPSSSSTDLSFHQSTATLVDDVEAHEQTEDPNIDRFYARGERSFTFTPFSLMVSATIIGIGGPKIVAAYQGEQVAANTLDWVLGIPIAFMYAQLFIIRTIHSYRGCHRSFWLGILKEQNACKSLKWFLTDDIRDIPITS